MGQEKFQASKHAEIRIAQRGICIAALEILFEHGDEIMAGSGCFRTRLRWSQARDLRQEGVPLRVVESALRTEAIFSGDETLVTCWKRDPHRAAGGSRGRRRSSKFQNHTLRH